MLTQGEYVSFPEECLSALIEENAMQKIETERLLEKLQKQDYLLDEYKRAIDDEIKKGN